MKYTIFLYFLLSLSFPLAAQDLNGIWKGTLSMSGGCFPVNHIEIQIHLDGERTWGDSYHYQDINYYVKKNFTGIYFPTQKRILLREADITTFKIPGHCVVCIKNYDLYYSVHGDQEILKGEWNGKIAGTGKDCTTGNITLYRTKESAFKSVPEISVDTGSIRLDFYDNGMIDGDSISVMVNKNVILSHQKLSAKPITVHIQVNLQQTFHEVEMIANNLGTIPPNTALLIITAGEKRYRLFLTSTEAKSAMIRFVYEDPGKKLLPL